MKFRIALVKPYLHVKNRRGFQKPLRCWLFHSPASSVLLTVLFLTCSVIQGYGQLTLKNQFEYTHWREFDRNIVENWTDLSYQKNFMQLGLRYEINKPPDPFIFPQTTLLKEYELTYRYAEFSYKNLKTTIGNFYSTFGRGLTLRTYEDRNLRVDNNIEGLKLNLSGNAYKLQTIAGRMRDKYNRRQDVIYGLDAEFSLIKGWQYGGSYLYQDAKTGNADQLWALRVNYSPAWGELYGEIARPDWHNELSYYFALSASYSKFSLTAEYKNYDRLFFKNNYGAEYNAGPSLTKEHSFTLLNRHPHALNMDDETGYQLELSYLPTEDWEFSFNHSQTYNHQDKKMFQEFYGDLHHHLTEDLDVRGAAAYTFDFTTNTENITPIADALYDLSWRDQLHLSYQHQHTINKFDQSEFDTELMLIEYSRSPLFSLAVVSEFTNKDQIRNIDLERNYWLYGMLTMNFLTKQQLSILFGSRQEGFVCVGGICRYEPEFEGVEIKFVTQF